MDLNKRIQDIEDAQKRFGMALSRIHDEIIEIREDMKLLTSNDAVLSLANFVQSIRGDLQTLESEVQGVKKQLESETQDRIAGDSALSNNISGSNTRISKLESLTTTQGTNIQTNAKNITTINNQIGSIQNAAGKMPKILEFCQLVSKNTPYCLRQNNVGRTDGNGWMEFVNANYGLPSNDLLIAVAPYDYRSSNYNTVYTSWSDASSDTVTQVRFRDNNWNYVTNITVRAWYAQSCPYSNFNFG